MANCKYVKYVMFINADMYLSKGWYGRIRKLLTNNYDVIVAKLIPLFRYQGPLTKLQPRLNSEEGRSLHNEKLLMFHYLIKHGLHMAVFREVIPSRDL